MEANYASYLEGLNASVASLEVNKYVIEMITKYFYISIQATALLDDYLVIVKIQLILPKLILNYPMGTTHFPAKMKDFRDFLMCQNSLLSGPN